MAEAKSKGKESQWQNSALNVFEKVDTLDVLAQLRGLCW